MGKSHAFRVAAAVLALASVSRAAGDDPLVEADRALKEGPLAEAASLGKRAAAVADYCMVQERTGPEGMPYFLHFSCTDGVRIPFMRRWCWTARCREGFSAEMTSMMRAGGYEPLASFHFGRPDLWGGYSVFKRASAPGAQTDGYCVGLRNVSSSAKDPEVFYSIDCADGAVTELRVVEPANGTTAVARYMGDRDFELAGRFEYGRSSSVLFRRKVR